LCDFKSTIFEVLNWSVFQYCGMATVMNISDKFVWRVIVVYEFPYEEAKGEFVEELHRVMSLWVGPTLVGGDFNLVRNQNEKSNGCVNFKHAELFNNWNDTWGLIEIRDPSRNFSWSNNQSCPIMTALGMILISVDWDAKYSLARVKMFCMGVSDHNPLVVEMDDQGHIADPLFRFEKWWLEIEEFSEVVKKAWGTECPFSEPVEVWQFKVRKPGVLNAPFLNL
jgi:hypothetical protein